MNHTEDIKYIEWMHPTKGKIKEEVCPKHRNEVLGALKTLGIDCFGEPSKLNICWRCIYDGYHFKTWMDKLNEVSD
jgi:hypothetical protein